MSTPRIAILPSDVADQIAAGEVVERPASVVKELVENALDAGATALDIAVQEGGRALIHVGDDGHGMPSDDAKLAVARHATSKIRRAQDLVGVSSFGFRGEALPAIGSVAHLEIETATDDGAGTRVEVSGGTLVAVSPASRRRGTSVTVRELFYNTPARRKFLRGARAEWRAISEVLTTVALLRRDVRIRVEHDGREQFQLPTAASLRERVGALWGSAVADALVAVDDVQGPIRVSGLVERPSDVGTIARRTFLSVNGRAVRDTGIVRAAESAYRSTIQAGLRPSLLLEVELPSDVVDVNVHPAKAEVRFHDRWQVERAVERAVRRALGTEESGAVVGVMRAVPMPLPPIGREVGIETLRSLPEESGPLFDHAPVASAPTAPLGADAIIVPPLTQFNRTYITFERPDALVLIDQHSAHERVLFERFVGALESGSVPAQQLLFPLTLHLTPAEAEAFDQDRDWFQRLGFVAEPFGGSTLIVSAVPAPHPRFDAERCLRETLATLTGDRLPSGQARHERLAATVACKAAIKAGDLLSQGEMRALYLALAETTLPAHDVHGRSTILQLTWDELDRRFGRR